MIIMISLNKTLSLAGFILLLVQGLTAQVTGRWNVVDDRDGIQKSVVEIYEANGRYFGRVVQLLSHGKTRVCTKCEGERKDRPVEGMVILADLEKSPRGGRNGSVLDPESGSTYDCYIELVSPDVLKLRGYLGMPAFGRTQYWTRSQPLGSRD